MASPLRSSSVRWSILSLCLAAALGIASPAVGAVYYNDSVHAGSPANATNYSGYMADGGGFETPSGLLRDFSTGVYSGITASLSGSNISGSISAAPAAATDAYNVFDGKVNLGDWSTSYNSSSTGWYYEVTFTGLDPSKTYEFVTTANRNNPSYAGSGSSSRWTLFSISGADTYVNASTAGVTELSADQVEFNTGYNTLNGYVARWTSITAADGSFTVRSENVGATGPGEANKSYGMEGFMLAESTAAVPEPASAVIWLLLGLSIGGAAYFRRTKRAA